MLVWCMLSQRYQQNIFMEFIRLINVDQEFRGEIWAMSRMKPFFRSQGNEQNLLAQEQVIQKLWCVLFQVANLLLVVKRVVCKESN